VKKLNLTKTITKLSLNRQTLAKLSTTALIRVEGGEGPASGKPGGPLCTPPPVTYDWHDTACRGPVG